MRSDIKVLHLTPHLGGGVGTVVRSYLEYETTVNGPTHSVAALDSLNPESKELLTRIGLKWVDNAYRDSNQILNMISEADVVLIHWWNHPLLQDFLMNQDFPDCRLIIWSHISGNSSPNNFSHFILNLPDRFIFTTPLSHSSPDIKRLLPAIRDRIGTIWSTAGVEQLMKFGSIERAQKKKSEVSIGYVGNLDYTKLHVDFLRICEEISSLGIKIDVIGPLTEEFRKDLAKSPAREYVRARGFIPETDKFELMRNFDILIYPLSRQHYGTCDQVLQEAMALGAVPVVLNNPMESYMIDHNNSGMIAADRDEFIEHVFTLVNDFELRSRMGWNGHLHALQNYRIEDMADRWKIEFNNLVSFPKKAHIPLSSIMGRRLKAHEVFLESLDLHSGPFALHRFSESDSERSVWRRQVESLKSSPNWKSPTKSSAKHFSMYFPDDEWLSSWSALTT